MEKEARTTAALKAVALFALCLALVAVFIRGLHLLGTSGIVILAAILLTYLIAPIVGFFRRRMPLLVALLLVYLIIGVALAVAFVVIVPPLVGQARSLLVSLPPIVSSFQHQLADPHNPIAEKLPPDLRNYVNTLPAQISGFAARYGLGLVQGTLGAFFSIVTLFMSLIIVPIFSMYLFSDASIVKRSFLGFVPPAARPKTLAILADLNATIGAFIRGQVLDGLILGAMITAMLWIMHVPYALLIGVSAGILNLIPYLGAIVGFIPSVLLAWIFNGWESALIVGILFGVIQQIDGSLILPRIMKDSVALSPLIIIAAILIFSALFGLVGTFLAVPVAAMLRVLKLHFAPAPPDAEYANDQKRALSLEVL
ncbi:MAG TPA: AI-2E family transporter [Candidatus Acidoferrales bacterium]|nr:AI-2E family transporter [Candidatus Acidoferrales bacterium]